MRKNKCQITKENHFILKYGNEYNIPGHIKGLEHGEAIGVQMKNKKRYMKYGLVPEILSMSIVPGNRLF